MLTNDKPQGDCPQLLHNIFDTHRGSPEKIYAAMQQEWGGLRSTVRNENNFAAGIATNFLIQAAVTKLGPKCCALKAFSRSADVDPYKPLAAGVVKFNTGVQDGSDVMTNPTDFTGQSNGAAGDSTLTGPLISVAQYTVPFHLTNAQLNSGTRMADLVEAKLGSFLSKIVQVVTAPITIANFSFNAPLTINPAAFGFSDSATLQAQLKKSRVKNLILDGEYIARLSNSPGFFQPAGTISGLENAWKAFGWDLVGENTEWQGADPFVRGIACNPQAIGTVIGLPLNPAEGQDVIQTGVAVLPGPNVAIGTYLWMDANARTMRATYDIMLGATLLDYTAGTIIKSQ